MTTISLSILVTLTGFVLSIYLVAFLLGPPSLITEQNTIFYSQSHDIIGEEKGAERRYWVKLEEISDHVKDALIAVEDKHFYHHHGFDVRRIVKAIINDLRHLRLKEGASTITQQYARNLYLSHEKTWTRKLKEAFYTIRLELYYTKDEILEGYLNTVYFGHGAYGIEAASRHFFNKHAKDLTLAEAAMLISIPKGPTYYSPFNHEENANRRQKLVLNILKDQGKITEAEWISATHETLTYANHQSHDRHKLGPYFQDMALKEAAHLLDLDEELVRSGGYKIYTTLDSTMQKRLERRISQTIPATSELEIGAIAIDPRNGEILALVGGRDYQKSPYNRAVAAKRMTGSTFKPFLYYAALEHHFTPTTQLMSKPTAFVIDGGEVYQPSNYNGYYANKPITLAQALALSDNIYAVKTNLFLGVDQLIKTARLFGISSDLPKVPSLALGTASVSVKDMTTAYSMLANGGHKVHPHTIKKIIDRDGKTVYEREQEQQEQILNRENAFILTHLLTGMFDTTLNDYMPVTGATIANRLTRPYAGKSGTTKSDSWMIGYSPTLVTGIWTGYDDNRAIEVMAETTYAKNIWAGFMEDAHQGQPVENFPIPPGVVGVSIDPETGERATPYCPTSRMMFFKKGTEPKVYCTTHLPHKPHLQENEEIHEEKKGLFQRLFEWLTKD